MQTTPAVQLEQADASDLARRVREAYENLSPDGLASLKEIYSDDVCFEDPVHGIQGLDALVAYFEKLFTDVEQCRFKFHRSIISPEGMFFSWTMMLQHRRIKRGQVIRVEGASYLRTRDGKVFYHRDYFDLGAMVYENVPLLGGLIRMLRSRLTR